MFKVEAVNKKMGKNTAVVTRNSKFVGAASMPFIEWMQRNVPAHQLSPEQLALVQWYEDMQATGAG